MLRVVLQILHKVNFLDIVDPQLHEFEALHAVVVIAVPMMLHTAPLTIFFVIIYDFKNFILEKLFRFFQDFFDGQGLPDITAIIALGHA